MSEVELKSHVPIFSFRYPAFGGVSELLQLYLVLFVKLVCMVAAIQWAGIGLVPDEAQYWTWSKQLDWGYYSKPPGVAWMIWGGTQLLGDTELGVRFPALLVGVLVPLAIFRCARLCSDEKIAFWAAVTWALSPAGIFVSFLTTTDGPMVLCWTLACAELVAALHSDQAVRYATVGFWIFCGALFKWAIYFLWPVIVVLALFMPRLRSKEMAVGMAISLIGLLPSLFWNIDHEWVTFRHVGATLYTAQAGSSGNFFDFIAAQALLLFPIPFYLLLVAWIRLRSSPRTISRGFQFLGFASLFILGSYAFVALFKKVQGNWCIYSYPMAIIFLCGVIRERRLLKIGLALSVVASAFLFTLPALQESNLLPLSFKWNPHRHSLGWKALAQALDEVRYSPEEDFLFGDKYQVSSILSFYSAGQKRAYFLNLQRSRNNQFCFWPGMAAEQVGKTGYFVFVETSDRMADFHVSHYAKLLAPYFAEVKLLSRSSLFSCSGKPAKEALIYKCSFYNGKECDSVSLY